MISHWPQIEKHANFTGRKKSLATAEMYSFCSVLEIIWSLFRNEIFEYWAYNPFIHFSASKNVEVAGYPATAWYPATVGRIILHAGYPAKLKIRPDNPALPDIRPTLFKISYFS